jgi:hypothetical protein
MRRDSAPTEIAGQAVCLSTLEDQPVYRQTSGQILSIFAPGTEKLNILDKAPKFATIALHLQNRFRSFVCYQINNYC